MQRSFVECLPCNLPSIHVGLHHLSCCQIWRLGCLPCRTEVTNTGESSLHSAHARAQAMERATLQRLVGVQQEAVRARLCELQAEAEAQLDAMAPAYALTLLQHAAPRQPHQETFFFSALHEAPDPGLANIAQLNCDFSQRAF